MKKSFLVHALLLLFGIGLCGARAQETSAQFSRQPPSEMAVPDAATAFSDLPEAPQPQGGPRVAGPEASSADAQSGPATAEAADPGRSSFDFAKDDAENYVQEDRPSDKLRDCPYAHHAPECKVYSGQLAIETSLLNAFQNGANAYTGYYYRYETVHGRWFDRYVNSVTGYKFSTWSDGNPFLDDYVGHPMMGAITNALWIQNDPEGMTLTQSNDWVYWRSRLRALAFSTLYSTQWKLGPAGESGIGHAGDHLSYDNHRFRNETGFVSLVTTPVGGFVWTLGEDALDKYVIARLENVSRNPFALTLYTLLFSPARGTGNLLRFRPVWYRDSRVVKADTFWSDPEWGSAGITDEGPGGRKTKEMKVAAAEARSARNQMAFPGDTLPPDAYLPGGQHELGAWWGLSLHSGHILGFEKDVRYMPIMVHYSYRFLQTENFSLRYAPEITALQLIDEEGLHPVDQYTLRQRTYGSGISPVGFQLDFLPKYRVQPFLSENSGMSYMASRVFSNEASQLLFSTDLGIGVNIFRKMRQAVTLGYRYQHLSNANISNRNPGTDANTFYVGVSRFRTKGVL